MDATPHEVLKGTAATKKTPTKIKRVQSARAREKAKASQRSGKWTTVRKRFLAKNKKVGRGCEACGNTVGLQVHHARPYHLHPELELIESNLRALCSSVTGLECHEFLGHGSSFKAYVPIIDELCAELRADPTKLAEIRKRAKAARCLV
jgi:hypothetical protein